MKEQIRNLRIKIDELAQLTKGLSPKQKFIVDIAQIPKTLDWTVEEWLGVFNRTNYGIIDSNEIKDFDFNTFITPIPFESQPLNKAVDSLYLAKAWLGKVLGELGTENPYGSGYKTKEDIVPTQDVAPKIGDKIDSATIIDVWRIGNNLNPNHIEKVDWLRTEIDKIIKDIESITWLEQKNSIVSKLNHLFNNCYNHLCEARFWLGFEMERIKNN